MELIDRYVYQVSRHIPVKSRDDVEIKLRSMLIDALEERAGVQAGDESAFSKNDQVAILEEFGPPAQTAAKYVQVPQYIVGPKFYNIFMIVVVALAGAGLVASIVTIAMSVFSTASGAVGTPALIGRALSLFFNIFIFGVGSATLTFAVLERLIPGDGINLEEKQEWDPRNLLASEGNEQIKPTRLIVQVVFLALLLILFIAYGNYGWHVIPLILSPAFFSVYLPLLEIRWGLTILLNLILLRQTRWQPGTSLTALFLEAFDIYILARLVSGPSMIDDKVLDSIFPILKDIPGPPFDATLRLSFSIALVVIVVLTVIKAYRLVRNQMEKHHRKQFERRLLQR